MSLADRLHKPPQRPGSRCAVTKALEAMSDKDRELAERALADERFTGVYIADALTGEGWPMSSHTVQRHRRHGCGCEPR